MEPHPGSSGSNVEPSVSPTDAASPSTRTATRPVPKLHIELPTAPLPLTTAGWSMTAAPSSSGVKSPKSTSRSSGRKRAKSNATALSQDSSTSSLPRPVARYPPLPPSSPYTGPRNYDALFSFVDEPKPMGEDSRETKSALALDLGGHPLSKGRELSTFRDWAEPAPAMASEEDEGAQTRQIIERLQEDAVNASFKPVSNSGPLDAYLPHAGPEDFRSQAYLPSAGMVLKQTESRPEDYSRMAGRRGVGCMACLAAALLFTCTDCCCCC